MENFKHYIPTELRFGKGVTDGLPDVLSAYGKSVLLVYGGGSILKNGIHEYITDMLRNSGFQITECSGVEPNPRVATVARGADLCQIRR